MNLTTNGKQNFGNQLEIL